MIELLKQKYIHAWVVQISAIMALYMGRMDGPSYVALSSLIFGIYAAANVTDKKLNPPETP